MTLKTRSSLTSFIRQKLLQGRVSTTLNYKSCHKLYIFYTILFQNLPYLRPPCFTNKKVYVCFGMDFAFNPILYVPTESCWSKAVIMDVTAKICLRLSPRDTLSLKSLSVFWKTEKREIQYPLPAKKLAETDTRFRGRHFLKKSFFGGRGFWTVPSRGISLQSCLSS